MSPPPAAWRARQSVYVGFVRHPAAATRRPAAGAARPDPFSLADPAAARAILDAAGFAGVAFTDVREPVYYGPDVDAALHWVRGFSSTSDALSRLDPAAAARALGRLRETLTTRMSDDGIWFDSRSWILTARRG